MRTRHDSPPYAEPGDTGLACLGTTHFINAIIRRKGLARVAVLRLCGPATVALPPFCDMPPDLCAAIGCSYRLLSGMALPAFHIRACKDDYKLPWRSEVQLPGHTWHLACSNLMGLQRVCRACMQAAMTTTARTSPL